MLKSLFAVVLTFFCSGLAFTQTTHIDDASSGCGLSLEMDKFDESFFFFESKCLGVPPKERCSCLANEKASNIFVAALDDNQSIEQIQEHVRLKRTENFWDTYKQMIHGAALQREILFAKDVELGPNGVPLVKDNKVIGCPPSEISKEFKSKLKDGIDDMKDLQEKELGSRKKELEKCVDEKGIENCRWLEMQVQKLDKDVNQKKSVDFDRLCEKAGKNNEKSYAQIQLEGAKRWYNQNPTAPDAQLKKNKIDCFMLLISAGQEDAHRDYKKLNCPFLIGIEGSWPEQGLKSNLTDSEMANSAQGIFGGTKKWIKFVARDVGIVGAACDYNPALIGELITDLEEDKLFIKRSSKISFADEKYSDVSSQKSQCDGDILCESFERTNNAAFKSLKDEHELRPGQCLTYPMFLLRRGIPGDLFLKELAGIAETENDKLAKMLTPPDFIRTEADQQRMRFLKSNPLLLKLTQVPQARESLARELQKIAKSADNKTPAQKMKNYLSFMKGPVKIAMGSSTEKDSQAYMCQQMINHFTGVVLATDLPPYNKESDLPLTDAIISCKVALNNLTSVTDTHNFSDYSDLFKNKKIHGDLPELSEEEEFEKMNKEECAGFEDWAKENCVGKNKTQALCAEAFRRENGIGNGQDEVVHENNVTTQLVGQHFQSASRYSQPEYQDTAFKQSWKRRVGRRLTTPAVPFKGKTEEYAQAMQDDQSKVLSSAAALAASSKKRPSYANEEHVIDVPKKQGQNKVNPGQIIPTYQEPGTFNPEKLSPHSNVTEAIQDYDWLSPGKKIAGLKKAKKFLESNDLKNLNDNVQEEKLSEINNEIIKQKEKPSNISSGNSFSASGPQFSTQVNNFASGTNTVLNNGSSTSNSSENRSLRMSAGPNGQGAVNDAIIKKHEMHQENISGPIQIQIRPGVVNEKELGIDLEITQELLVESFELNKLSESPSALEAYLRLNLVGEDLMEEDFAQERIISIADKNLGPGAANLIFRVKFEHGKYIVQSMPGTVPVKRSATLKNLQQNLAI